jgi:uncharacterized membrane protein YbhN (UPF0104 family)
VQEEVKASSKLASRKYVGYVLIVLVFGVFWLYMRQNPSALEPLKAIPLIIIPLLLLLYSSFLSASVAVTALTIRFCDKNYPLSSSFLLTIYSTLVNFFGPLQSGPGFRAIYLKKRISISIKDYSIATSLYYVSFALVSLIMLFGIIYPWVLLLAVLVLVLFSVYDKRRKGDLRILGGFLIIFIVTLLQLSILALIYFIELRATGFNPSLGSTLAYTGSANFALFVAFTPGAIGIRESFIYFAQSIHDIPTEHVLSASLLDRSIYILFLLILLALSSALHIKAKLNEQDVK